jgi:hypothetical protein
MATSTSRLPALRLLLPLLLELFGGGDADPCVSADDWEGAGECCPVIKTEGPSTPRNKNDQSYCPCWSRVMDTQLGRGLAHLSDGRIAWQQTIEVNDLNPLLNLTSYEAFRSALFTFEDNCPAEFDGISDRVTRLGAGTQHLVYGVDDNDAATLGLEHAILRANKFESCWLTDAMSSLYVTSLLDSFAVLAWINVKMGAAGVGPRIPYVCLKRAEKHDKPSLNMFVFMDRYPTSVQSLLERTPNAMLNEEQLLQQVEFVTTQAELALSDLKLGNVLARPGSDGRWDVALADFDPPWAARKRLR